VPLERVGRYVTIPLGDPQLVADSPMLLSHAAR
jgi:hypothetical protein